MTLCETNTNRPLPAYSFDGLRCPSVHGERDEEALQSRPRGD